VRLAFYEGLPGSVFVSGQGRLVKSSPEDYGSCAGAFRDAAGGGERTSALCVPISLPEQKLGVMLLESATASDAFSAPDLRFAGTLANQAAIAIGNALHLRRMLEMDRHRRGYLSNVSHELRTPLTVIQGYMEALASEGLSVRREAAVKGVRLIERAGEGVPVLPGDDRLLHLLVLNLIENAIKFTPKGGEVEAEVEKAGQDVILRVRDSGIGIAPEHQERIFEKFFVVDQGASRSHGGAGIGLYLAREVVSIHDGRIRVESAPGRGSCFEVRLPLRPER